MTGFNIRCVPVSETSVMLYLADEIDVALAPLVAQICRRIKEQCPQVRELTPSYCSVLVENGPAVGLAELGEKVLAIAVHACNSWQPEAGAVSGKLIELPVYYHPDVAPDLVAVADHAGLSIEQVIAIHSGLDYTVCAIGFAPGFAFLADLDPRIAMPRHDRPRAKVAAGSVGIAEKQTAVYPLDTPGGWQLIGSCPVPLYDPRQVPLSPFEVGDRVRFVAIDLAQFIERGGRV